MTNGFTQLNLHPELVQAVTELGYTEPTPIQSAVIPMLIEGQDVIGEAQTGTGKTAAFALPILQKITPGIGHVQCLILAPTRELAMQVAKATHEYGRHNRVSVMAIYGGQPYERQIRQLRKGVDIVVGTPGRLLDLIRQRALDLSNVSTVVLDEADEMLSMGFVDDIKSLLDRTPKERQTALFSATLPSEIRRLADKYMKSPKSVTVQRQAMTVSTISQRYCLVNESDKLAALTRLFEIEPITSALIFTRTRDSTSRLAKSLSTRGFPAEALNGDLSQGMREQVLNRFRRSESTVLVATDVAARGLDIDDISHVFNFDLPPDPEIYVHRVGRTGRAGKTGIAISLITPKEHWQLRRTEKYTKQQIERIELPTVEQIQNNREEKLLEQMAIWLRRGRYRRERELVTAIIEEGFDAYEVASAALKVARMEEKQRPIAPVSKVEEMSSPRGRRDRGDRDRPRGGGSRQNGRGTARTSHERGMTRLRLNAGKMHGISPSDVVGTIAQHADIPGHSIGAIQIQSNQTFVDVPEQLVEQVLSQKGKYRIRKHAILVNRA